MTYDATPIAVFLIIIMAIAIIVMHFYQRAINAEHRVELKKNGLKEVILFRGSMGIGISMIVPIETTESEVEEPK